MIYFKFEPRSGAARHARPSRFHAVPVACGLNFRLIGAVALAIQPLGSTLHAQAAPDSAFIVGDIRVEGLQRISEGTVFNYLPVNIGDHLDQQRIGEAMRALYATGFFRDVELRRDGNTLLVVVVERPSIAKFEIKGNKDIKTEDLQKSLRNVGLARARPSTGRCSTRSSSTSPTSTSAAASTRCASTPRSRICPATRSTWWSTSRKASAPRSSMINLVGNTKFKEKDVLQTLRAEDAELAVLVQAG